MTRPLGWYVRRLRRMSPGEMATRSRDQMRQRVWSRRQVRPGEIAPLPGGLREDRQFPTPLPEGTRDLVPGPARAAVIAAAELVLAGEWSVLGTRRPDIADPDWFADPVTGRRAPDDTLAFRIDQRDESRTGNVKSVWELSRHHHLTVLASAYWLTGDDAYADVVADQLRSWWRANPFLSGIHWTSGIELAVRLTAWAWIRRLLDDWPKVSDLFETDEDALRQIWWHQAYLTAFRSTGSSANNHVVAEATGRLVGACAFPWYAETDQWRTDAADQLAHELRANTFDSGLNRELATDYHGFVAELGLVAAVEADAAGHPLPDSVWELLARSLDVAAAVVDVTGRPPRQGDGDEGRALVLDAGEVDPWALLLGIGAEVVGARPWWPAAPTGVAAVALSSLAAPHDIPDRPLAPPSAFPDAGMAILRTAPEDGPEIWCRCDGGPHGFLSIAAHAHADALSVEVRYDGIDVLADPGTYCYHGEPEWRSYFRSTLAHNTIEVDRTSQSVEGGPFMWSTHAQSGVDATTVGGAGPQVWSGHHDGYARLDAGLRHQRAVALDRSSRHLSIVDKLTGDTTRPLRLTFHLGPDVNVRLSGTVAELTWPARDGVESADLHLPGQLRWTEHRGETDPILGWYSPRFGQRVPTTTLVGTGACDHELELRTLLVFPSA